MDKDDWQGMRSKVRTVALSVYTMSVSPVMRMRFADSNAEKNAISWLITVSAQAMRVLATAVNEI